MPFPDVLVICSYFTEAKTYIKHPVTPSMIEMSLILIRIQISLYSCRHGNKFIFVDFIILFIIIASVYECK